MCTPTTYCREHGVNHAVFELETHPPTIDEAELFWSDFPCCASGGRTRPTESPAAPLSCQVRARAPRHRALGRATHDRAAEGRQGLGMKDLLDLVHDHDLPPKWDGHPVEWEGWQSPPPIFFCPPRRPQPCTACGRFGEPVMNHGTATRRGILSLRPGVRSRFRLIAYRCPHCAFDQVWEVDTHKFWDLDYTDYGDEGSRA